MAGYLCSDGRYYQHIAWTGGSRPAALLSISRVEREIVSDIFQKQVCEFRAFWGVEPERDILRTYWSRARYEAHATIRYANHSTQELWR